MLNFYSFQGFSQAIEILIGVTTNELCTSYLGKPFGTIVEAEFVFFMEIV